MPKRSIEEMENLFQGALIGTQEAFDREMEVMIGLETEHILTGIEEVKPGRLTTTKELASYTSGDTPVNRYIVHAAMLAALRTLGREREYYRADGLPLEGNNLPAHVRQNGWMLLLPMRDGSRPIFKFRPSDEGDGYRFSMAIYRQGDTSSQPGKRRRKKTSS